MNVKYIYNSFPAQRADGSQIAQYEQIPVRHGFMYENKRVYPRTFFSESYKVIEKDEDALKEMMKADAGFLYRPDKELVVDREPRFPAMPDFGEQLPAEPMYNVVKWEPEEIVMKVKTPKNALLFFSEMYYPGWKAVLDKKPVDVMRASYTFRAVPVPRGEYTLRMWYEPEDVSLGFTVSIVSMLVVCGLLLLLKFTPAGAALERFFRGAPGKHKAEPDISEPGP